MKISISKTTWFLLAGGFFLIAMVVLGMNYRSQAEEQAQLKGQITLTKKNIARIPIAELTAKQTSLNAQLAETNARIEDNKTSLRQSTEAIQIVKTLFEIAKNNNVDLYDEKSPGLTTQNLEKMPFMALPFTVKVKGSVPNIIEFVKGVTTQFSTSTINSVQISVPSPHLDLIISPTWSLDSGSLPEGLKLDPSTGAISGIPDSTGIYTFTVKADFNDDTSATKDLSLTIDPHSITTDSINKGELHIPYTQVLGTTGRTLASGNVATDDVTPTAAITMNILSYEEK
jgi:hypothetical protein